MIRHWATVQASATQEEKKIYCGSYKYVNSDATRAYYYCKLHGDCKAGNGLQVRTTKLTDGNYLLQERGTHIGTTFQHRDVHGINPTLLAQIDLDLRRGISPQKIMDAVVGDVKPDLEQIYNRRKYVVRLWCRYRCACNREWH